MEICKALPQRAALVMAIIVIGAMLAQTAKADQLWMSEQAIRDTFIRHQLKGYYQDQTAWTETYGADGRITYSDPNNFWRGRWSFRGPVFCTYYNGNDNGGCFVVIKLSSNCFDIYAVAEEWQERRAPPSKDRWWNARGWRTDLPSTCTPGAVS